MKLPPGVLCAIMLGWIATGCGEPRAVGDADEIVVATSREVWNALGPEIRSAIEPRAFTVRDERIFDVAYLQPGEDAWDVLPRRRQVLLIGSIRDPLIAEALDRRGADQVRPPVVVQVSDVWAGNQTVTIALLPEDADTAALAPLLPRIGELYIARLEESVRIAMAATTPNERLTRTLRALAGFTLELPYGFADHQPEPGVFVFQREEQTPDGRIVETVTVASRRRRGLAWTPDAARSWRATLAERLSSPPRRTEMLASAQAGVVNGQPTLQIHGVWSNPPGGWPAAGPFLARMIDCHDRAFLLDAAIYAPGVSKYPSMYRLDMLLDTFGCPPRSNGMAP